MTAPQIVTVYSDYKSPYAYLAKDLAYELASGCPAGKARNPGTPASGIWVPGSPPQGVWGGPRNDQDFHQRVSTLLLPVGDLVESGLGGGDAP